MTTVIALVFLVPLGFALRDDARSSALAAASRQAAAVVGAAAATADPKAVRRAVEAGGGEVYVHGLDGGGAPKATATDVARAAAAAGPIVVDAPGGLVHLEPVKVGNQVAVVEVFIPEARLEAGSHQTWLMLLALAAGLVLATVLVVDRLAQ